MRRVFSGRLFFKAPTPVLIFLLYPHVFRAKPTQNGLRSISDFFWRPSFRFRWLSRNWLPGHTPFLIARKPDRVLGRQPGLFVIAIRFAAGIGGFRFVARASKWIQQSNNSRAHSQVGRGQNALTSPLRKAAVPARPFPFCRETGREKDL